MKRLTLLAVIAIGASLTSCNPDPSVTFTPSATSVMIDEVITFTNSSTDAYDYRWDFGDGGYSEVENPTYSYDVPGTYTVTLQATDKKSKELYTAVASIEVTIDEHTQWEIDREADRNAMIDIMVGKWDGTHTTSSNSNLYPTVETKYTIEIFEEGTLLMTETETGDVSAGSWSYISDKYIMFNGELWSLSAKSGKVTMTQTYEWASGVGTISFEETIVLD
ncbi:MAG: PKD domain-containing protein [Flavobacteriales bacterium]